MHRHVCIAFFRFPVGNLADITSRFAHRLSTYFAGNSPYITASTTHPHRHAFVSGVGVSASSHHFSYLPPITACCPLYYLSTADDRTKRIAEHVKHVPNASNSERNPNTNHAHQRHYRRRYDYEPVTCPTTAVTTWLAFELVSHDNSTLATNGHSMPARCIWVDR